MNNQYFPDVEKHVAELKTAIIKSRQGEAPSPIDIAMDEMQLALCRIKFLYSNTNSIKGSA